MSQTQASSNYQNAAKESIRLLQTDPQFRDEEFLNQIEYILIRQPFIQYFQGLNKQQIRNVAKKIKILTIPPNALFISKDGYVSVNYGAMDHHQLKYQFTGDTIGSQSLIYNQPVNYQAHAGSAGCVLAFLEKEDFNLHVKLCEMIRIQKYISMMKKIDLLKPFNEEQILQIFFASNLMEVPKNDFIYSFNQPSKGFYLIIQGSVKVNIYFLIYKLKNYQKINQIFIKNAPIVNDQAISNNSPKAKSKDLFTTVINFQRLHSFLTSFERQKRQMKESFLDTMKFFKSNQEGYKMPYLPLIELNQFTYLTVFFGSFSTWHNVENNQNIFKLLQNRNKSFKSNYFQEYQTILTRISIKMTLSKNTACIILKNNSQSINSLFEYHFRCLLEIEQQKESLKKHPKYFFVKNFFTSIKICRQIINLNQNRQCFSQDKPAKQYELKISDRIKSFRLNIQQVNTPSFSENSDRSLQNQKFLQLQDNLSSLSDRNNQSPLSIFRNIVKNESNNSRLAATPDKKQITFGLNSEEGKEFSKEFIGKSILSRKAKDASTITPFSYQDDYFEQLLKKDIEIERNQQIFDQDTDTNEALPSSPQATKLRQEVLKKQTEQQKKLEDDTNLISEFQINYLRESQTKFSQNSLSDNFNLSTTHFSSQKLIQLNEQSQFTSQCTRYQLQDNQKRSTSLHFQQKNVKSNSLSSIKGQKLINFQPKILNCKYKLISQNSPLKNISLIRADKSTNEEIENNNNNNTIVLSPSLRLNVSRLSSKNKETSQTQTFLTQKRNTMVKYTQICNNPRHQKSISAIFKSKIDLNTSQFKQNDIKQDQNSILKSPQKYKSPNSNKLSESQISFNSNLQKQSSQISDNKEGFQQNLLKNQQLNNSLNPTPVSQSRFELNLMAGIKTSTNFFMETQKSKSFYLKKLNETATVRTPNQGQSILRQSLERCQDSDQKSKSQTKIRQHSNLQNKDLSQNNGATLNFQRSSSQKLKQAINLKMQILSQNMGQIKYNSQQLNNFSDYVQHNNLIES